MASLPDIYALAQVHAVLLESEYEHVSKVQLNMLQHCHNSVPTSNYQTQVNSYLYTQVTNIIHAATAFNNSDTIHL